MNGKILDKALTLRLALLIIPFRCLLKLSLPFTLIPGIFFTGTVFSVYIPNFQIHTTFLIICDKMTFITICFHLVV